MKFSDILAKLGDAAICNSLNLNKDNDPEIAGMAAVDEA
ncbi:MAG: UDP-3-O-(3-hydroxymyristoyl)glucosamine N-acyltransferase, partial [Fischerella thermalis M48_A2018_028]|nr:UDP-3-O-(3-hydroxymyristoyl)glucosamine N-acyltransferase [Fischerella thermalis M48_A2018_028]